MVRAAATTGGGRCDDHSIWARRRPARPGPGRGHGRAAPADQPGLPAAGLAGRGRGRRPGGLRPLVCDDRPAAGRHRLPRRLADHGDQPDLPGPARLGAGPAGDLRGLLDPPAAARPRGVGRPGPRPGPAEGAAGGRGAAGAAPADRVTLDESVTWAFLVVREAMPPAERVALILHDVFGSPFAEVARIVGRPPAACRQLASSAR